MFCIAQDWGKEFFLYLQTLTDMFVLRMCSSTIFLFNFNFLPTFHLKKSTFLSLRMEFRRVYIFLQAFAVFLVKEQNVADFFLTVYQDIKSDLETKWIFVNNQCYKIFIYHHQHENFNYSALSHYKRQRFPLKLLPFSKHPRECTWLK